MGVRVNYVRGDLRDQLTHVGHDVVLAGLVVGSGGNLSARAADGDTCWVTAAGTWLDRLARASFVRVRIADGAVLDPASGAALRAGTEPGRTRPSSEVALHLATYRARPDVNAVLHLHPQALLLLDALGERVRLVTTDHDHYVRTVARTPYRPPGGAALAAEAASAAAAGADCVLLARHGCSVLGESVELAHKRVRNLAEAAELTYRALVLGRAHELPEFDAATRPESV